MTNLTEIIGVVTTRLKNFRSFYEQNEMAVRDQLVNPILRGLAWDPENPEYVQPNVSTEEGIPDYSLIQSGKKILFIEAKKLNVDIEQREVMKQLAKYSFGEGTKYGLLTNGAVWILIRSFEEGTSLTERVVWKADLENEDISSVIRKIITISKNNVNQIEILVKKSQILNEIWQSLIDEPEDMINGLLPVIKKIIAQGYPAYQFEDIEIQDLLRERIKEMGSQSPETVIPIENDTTPIILQRGESPQKMKLSGETFDLRNSFEVLVNTANWIIKKGKLKPSDCPVGVGHKRNLVHTQPKHKYGNDFRAPKKLSNGLWIETHYSTAMCINYARRLLEKFGFSPDTLVIE